MHFNIESALDGAGYYRSEVAKKIRQSIEDFFAKRLPRIGGALTGRINDNFQMFNFAYFKYHGYKGGVFTITADNGKEFSYHEVMTEYLKCCVYFADQYCS